jgi:probable rRNA maturation factor
LSIVICYDQIKYRVYKIREIKRFLEKVIRLENKEPGDLTFIFTNDEQLLEMNIKYLNHTFFTDVISFDYSEKEIVNGEIYMSIDTIKRNAISYGTGMREELLRVMIHGVLHLCGYRDKINEDRNVMFARQEDILKELVKDLNEL